MSRCFPYPPPGYTSSKAAGNEALIDSIKLQRGREKTKTEMKKERKREKIEKKKAKEENAKQTKAGHFDHDAFGCESWENVKGGLILKDRKDDSEQLERSSITEEHEQPVSLQIPSYSSDSTENSSKRKRHGSPSNGTRAQGNILRIRFPSQKHIEKDIKDFDEQLCSTSGRIDKPTEHKNDAIRPVPDTTCSTSLAMATDFIVHGLPLRHDKDSSPQLDFTSQEIMHADSGSKRNKKLKRVAGRYRDLIENWNPFSQLSEHKDIDDEDWLFGRKHEEKQPEKKVRLSSELSCSVSSSLWLKAHYLHDGDVYALPYAVPF